METTKVTIEGIEYEVNLNEAKRLKLIKEVVKPITEVKHGDVYKSKWGHYIICINLNDTAIGRPGALWRMTGLNDNPMAFYSESAMNTEVMIKYLNQTECWSDIGNTRKYVGNIFSDPDLIGRPKFKK